MSLTTPLAVTAALAAGYWFGLRERCVRWGATATEAAAPMPGDELLAAPDLMTTRAVTIAAEPAAIWPWLVQFGPGRGGAYTYDWIENLFGLNMHSADHVLPQFQHVSVGDSFALGPGGPRMAVRIVEPERALVFAAADGTWVWSFALRPVAGGTRLISRNRIKAASRVPGTTVAYALVMEPASLVMERKMLLGFKERGERTQARLRELDAIDALPQPAAAGR
ncbi:SRPBCC family protein [Nocardia farcinica]|uniref:SRPBCC family protein n=1 Tax=Nocardia farcinica TaxID=37329 RepID=UPI00245491B4|nr:SRPBCC family protein [Nocardia farcinica]